MARVGYVSEMSIPVRRWPVWAAYAAAIWSATYAILGAYWSSGGDDFPFGLENDPGAKVSILSWVDADQAAPVLAVVSVLGLIVSVVISRGKGGGPLRLLVLGFAWVAAVLLAVIIPDYRVLVFVAYTPIVLVGTALGLISDVSLGEAFTWPIANQFLFLVGGLLWALCAIGYQRRTRHACVICGRGEVAAEGTTPSQAARWGRWATYVAVLVPILYAITRFAWALGIPLGITEDFLREGQETGVWMVGAALSVMAVIGAVLTLGLIRPWGEVFPRWFPVIGGRRVPPALAVIPAALVAVPVTSAGLMFVRMALFGGFVSSEDLPLGLDENWATIAPELLWPIWGVALAAATAAYYFRRRGVCQHCGRGGNDHVAGRSGVQDPGRAPPGVPHSRP